MKKRSVTKLTAIQIAAAAGAFPCIGNSEEYRGYELKLAMGSQQPVVLVIDPNSKRDDKVVGVWARTGLARQWVDRQLDGARRPERQRGERRERSGRAMRKRLAPATSMGAALDAALRSTPARR